MKLVLIEWHDSLGIGHRWEPVDDVIAEPLLCRSVGWIAAESDTAVVLIPNYHDADERREVKFSAIGDMTIPRSCIVEMRELHEGSRPAATPEPK